MATNHAIFRLVGINIKKCNFLKPLAAVDFVPKPPTMGSALGSRSVTHIFQTPCQLAPLTL